MREYSWPVKLFPIPSDVVRLICCLGAIREDAVQYESTGACKDFIQLGSSIRMLQILPLGSSSIEEFDRDDFEIEGWDIDACVNQICYLASVYRHLDAQLSDWEEGTKTRIGYGSFENAFKTQSPKLFGRLIDLNTNETKSSDKHSMNDLCTALLDPSSNCELTEATPTPTVLNYECVYGDATPLLLSRQMDSILDGIRNAFCLERGNAWNLFRKIPLECCGELPVGDPFQELIEIETASQIFAKDGANPIPFCQAWERYQSKVDTQSKLSFVDWVRSTTELEFDLAMQSIPDPVLKKLGPWMGDLQAARGALEPPSRPFLFINEKMIGLYLAIHQGNTEGIDKWPELRAILKNKFGFDKDVQELWENMIDWLRINWCLHENTVLNLPIEHVPKFFEHHSKRQAVSPETPTGNAKKESSFDQWESWSDWQDKGDIVEALKLGVWKTLLRNTNEGTGLVQVENNSDHVRKGRFRKKQLDKLDAETGNSGISGHEGKSP